MDHTYWTIKTRDGEKWGHIRRLLIDPSTRQIMSCEVILVPTGTLLRVSWDNFEIGQEGILLRLSDGRIKATVMASQEPIMLETLACPPETMRTRSIERPDRDITTRPNGAHPIVTQLGLRPEAGTLRIVGLGGSLALSSSSLTALKIALQGARDAGAQVELFDVRELNLPMFVPGMADVPQAVWHLVNTIYAADGLIWSSPVYHGTISGSFKNALDWLGLLEKRDPAHLTNKVVGLVCTAGGSRELQAIATMESVVRALKGMAVPLVLPISRARKVFDDPSQTDRSEMEIRLRGLGGEVTRVARQFGRHPSLNVDAQPAITTGDESKSGMASASSSGTVFVR